MSNGSNSEKLSGSARGLIAIVFISFAAIVALMFTLTSGGTSLF